jgi:hypothetical protein
MTRRIKIEELGDVAKKRTAPYIRLKGQWLKRAGFPPGSHVQLILVAPGKLELIHETPKHIPAN